MRARRGTFVEIAEDLKIGRKLASTLYNEELVRHSLDAEFIDDCKESIATYETIMRVASALSYPMMPISAPPRRLWLLDKPHMRGVYDRARTSQPQPAHSRGPIGVRDRG
jgi:hypothetical protein